MKCPIIKSSARTQKYNFQKQTAQNEPLFSCRLLLPQNVCVRVCVCALLNRCLLRDPGVQNECLGSGHLGRTLPSVSQICFLTHKPNQAGNQMAAQLGFIVGVWSSVKSPTIQHSVLTPRLAVTHSLAGELCRRGVFHDSVGEREKKSPPPRP